MNAEPIRVADIEPDAILVTGTGSDPVTWRVEAKEPSTTALRSVLTLRRIDEEGQPAEQVVLDLVHNVRFHRLPRI